jgi:hypothetical protein
MKRRNFLSGLMALPLGLKNRFLALKARFSGPKESRAPKYVVRQAGNPQLVELPDGSFQFPDGQIVSKEAMAEAFKRLAAELKEQLPNGPFGLPRLKK